jgi:hypothetical protein
MSLEFFAPFINTGCQLPLVFWPLNVFIGRGSSGYENFFRGSSMDESLGNNLLGTLGYLPFAWSTLHLQESRLSYQHSYLHMVLLSWKPHQKTVGTEEFVKKFDFHNVCISLGHWKLLWRGCNLKPDAATKINPTEMKTNRIKIVPYSQHTCIIKIIQLMMYREMLCPWSEMHTSHRNTRRG